MYYYFTREYISFSHIPHSWIYAFYVHPISQVLFSLLLCPVAMMKKPNESSLRGKGFVSQLQVIIRQGNPQQQRLETTDHVQSTGQGKEEGTNATGTTPTPASSALEQSRIPWAENSATQWVGLHPHGINPAPMCPHANPILPSLAQRILDCVKMTIKIFHPIYSS